MVREKIKQNRSYVEKRVWRLKTESPAVERKRKKKKSGRERKCEARRETRTTARENARARARARELAQQQKRAIKIKAEIQKERRESTGGERTPSAHTARLRTKSEKKHARNNSARAHARTLAREDPPKREGKRKK